MESIPYWCIAMDRWHGQPVHVSVWVEKEALVGVFQEPCDELGVSWFACKGYPSVSALAGWLDKAREACGGQNGLRRGSTNWMQNEVGKAARCVVLYFGDHDPDGLEIPRSCERNLDKLQRLAPLRWACEQALAYGWSQDDDGFADEVRVRAGDCPPEFAPVLDIEFVNVALTAEQIEQYDPPPFPAKPSSSRFRRYVEETGMEDAWELDALDPTVLRDLIREHVDRYWDQGIHDDLQADVHDARARLLSEMTERAWLNETFGTGE
jgi:hypothetical protein